MLPRGEAQHFFFSSKSALLYTNALIRPWNNIYNDPKLYRSIDWLLRDIHLYAVVWLVNPFRTVHISTGYILPILYNCTVQYSSFHLRGPNFNNCQNKQYSTVQKLSIWGKTGWYAKWIIPFNWNSYMHCTNTLLQMYTLTPYICTLCTR